MGLYYPYCHETWYFHVKYMFQLFGFIVNYPRTQWHKTSIYYFHGFCGSEIWKEHSVEGVSPLPSVWAWMTWKLEAEIMWRFIHTCVWRMALVGSLSPSSYRLLHLVSLYGIVWAPPQNAGGFFQGKRSSKQREPGGCCIFFYDLSWRPHSIISTKYYWSE